MLTVERNLEAVRFLLLGYIREIGEQLLAGSALRHVADLAVHVAVTAGSYREEILDQLVVKGTGALALG